MPQQDGADCLHPAESGAFIAAHATEVEILDGGVEKCAADILERVCSGQLELQQMFIKTPVHPQQSDDQGIDWVFFADTLNFSFWMPESGPQYVVTYKEFCRDVDIENSSTYCDYLFSTRIESDVNA